MTTHTPPSGLLKRLSQGSLVKQILLGLVLGVLLALVSKPAAIAVGLLGTLFVGALKAVAPVLVLMLVMASIANHQQGQKTNIRPILFLYLLGTFSAALTAVLFSFIFPSTLHLTTAADSITPPSGIVEVLRGLLMSMVANPIDALLNANYIGILVWAVGLGFALRHGNETTKNLVNDVLQRGDLHREGGDSFRAAGYLRPGLLDPGRRPGLIRCGATPSCCWCW
ncbi:Na(+)/serine-threonine symporter [Raoultella terrigena]|uniref:Na(+)/serine-threonine symporter n=1 Tax=Raoultella terrigena TaxID=577 RepID=A0A4U9D2L8_RAOTE|nr:Na(+)/serine-threonine symporter [Raoultella terrigena]